MRPIPDIKTDLANAIADRDAWEIDTDTRDFETRYDDMLDECYGEVSIAGVSYSTSNALKEVDPTAYRCGMNDYADGLDKEDFPEYAELCEAVEALECELEAAEEAQEGADQ